MFFVLPLSTHGPAFADDPLAAVRTMVLNVLIHCESHNFTSVVSSAYAIVVP